MKTSGVLQLSPRTRLVPVIHGSGDAMLAVRNVLLSGRCDCLAVCLPESFRDSVEAAVERLPEISVAIQREPIDWASEAAGQPTRPAVSYVPVEPCQPVISAIRMALQKRIPRAYIDLETAEFEVQFQHTPDPYALSQLPLERFAAGVLPVLPPPTGQLAQRCRYMGDQLRQLESRYRQIVALCGFREWPWIRAAYLPPDSNLPGDGNSTGAAGWDGTEHADPQTFAGFIPEHDLVEPAQAFPVAHRTLSFACDEIPFIAWLYEAARQTADDDSHLSVEGLKQLLLETRDHYRAEQGEFARRITPHLLSTYFRYVRNLALVERRLTPDMYSLAIAAKQIFGDNFVLSLLDVIARYPVTPAPGPAVEMGIGKCALPDGDIVVAKNRLAGRPMQWRNLEVVRRPERTQKDAWKTRFNPFGVCSWPPEDLSIERFRTHVKDVALGMLGQDLARTEKFSASMKDGLDIRETLRNWHTGDLYVKVQPPAKGNVDCVLMLFDSPADPREYPYRITWHAESHDESTLSFFSTDFMDDMIGPGIARARYGGAMFLFPARPIPDVFRDRRFDFADTLEERLLAAACQHSRHRHIVVLSHLAPGLGFRRLARRFGRKLLHVPLSRFGQERIEMLRVFHVLGGQRVRSYAAEFIRRS